MPKLSASPASARHLLHARQDVAVARRHQQRLARAAHHGVDLGEVVDRLRHVLGQAHAHDEVDVGQLLAECRHALDVGLAHAASLVRVGVADVEHVRAGAAVAVRASRTSGCVSPPRGLMSPVARRAARWRPRRARRGCARACPSTLAPALAKQLDRRRVPHLDAGLGEHLEGRFVHALAGVVVPDRQASFVHVATSITAGAG